MKLAGSSRLAVAALLLAAAATAWADDPTAPAETADTPYASIVERNMFALLPMPPPDTNPPAPPVDPPPKITPNGIMTIFGREQALFKVAEKAKPGQPAKDDSFVLAVGEREEDIEVTKIDKENGVITFNNHGTIQELPLVEVTAGGGGPGGGPGGPGGPANPANFGRGMSPAERANMFRNRQLERGGGMGVPSPGFNNNNMASPAQPSMGMGAGGGFQAQPQSQADIEDQVMSAARNMALIEQNRLDTQEAVNQGLLPPLPPTMLTPPDATGAGGSPLIVSPEPLVPGGKK